ncbi:MAG: pyridoxal phosphate-dependent aminotransferase [Halobacteriaceae archaeon]
MEYDEPAFFEVLRYAARVDRATIDMVSGNPDWDPPTALREGLHAYADADATDFQYPASAGVRGLRETIADRRNVDRDNVVVTNGAGEANYLATARALERGRGTEVVMTDPVYPYYPGRVSMLGGDQVFVPVDDDGHLDPDDVADVVSADTAAIIVNTPNNPTGAVYEAATMAALGDLAAANDAVLISDETYDHFDYSGRFTSALSIDATDRIVTTSFSKSMAITGFRVGYGIFPDADVDAVKTRHMLTNVAGSRPAQAAVHAALTETGPTYYTQTRTMLEERIDAFTDALDDAGAEYSRPEGAFYVMARLPGVDGTMNSVKRLIDETGVAGMPGDAFGTARADWVRFALVTPQVTEAADRLTKHL